MSTSETETILLEHCHSCLLETKWYWWHAIDWCFRLQFDHPQWLLYQHSDSMYKCSWYICFVYNQSYNFHDSKYILFHSKYPGFIWSWLHTN